MLQKEEKATKERCQSLKGCYVTTQVPRLLPERKQNESLDDETQVANRAVAAAGLANELEVLMATGKDPRILKKPVQQEEEIHHSKLDLPVETAAKAACQSARDLIKEPMWKGPQTKPVQKNPQIKLRQRSVTQEEKPLAAKKIAGNLIGEMFDYDLMYQVPRLLPERKQNESLDDETQVANRAVAAAGLANELEVLMATGKDPRILKKPVQQEEEIHHSKLDLPVETAAKAACQSARDLIKEPMWKGPQTKPVQKNPQIKLRQRSVTQEEKPLAAKKIAGNLIGEMFDYDLMYQVLRA
eukprot:Gb_28966 [translate_table: standard]